MGYYTAQYEAKKSHQKNHNQLTINQLKTKKQKPLIRNKRLLR